MNRDASRDPCSPGRSEKRRGSERDYTSCMYGNTSCTGIPSVREYRLCGETWWWDSAGGSNKFTAIQDPKNSGTLEMIVVSESSMYRVGVGVRVTARLVVVAEAFPV